MGKCVKCYDMFPPQFMHELDGVSEEVSQCVFCKQGKDYVMIRKDDGSEEKYTKKECKRDYVMLLKKLKETPNIAEKLAKKEIKIE